MCLQITMLDLRIMDKINIFTCNVRGLSTNVKRRQIFRHLHEQKASIILLQETHSTKTAERRYKNEWGGRVIFDHGESNSRGVSILFDRSLDPSVKKVKKVVKGDI